MARRFGGAFFRRAEELGLGEAEDEIASGQVLPSSLDKPGDLEPSWGLK